MLLKGRRQARVPERMLVQISAVRDRRLEELAPVEGPNPRGVRIKTQRPWEPGCHVDLKGKLVRFDAPNEHANLPGR